MKHNLIGIAIFALLVVACSLTVESPHSPTGELPAPSPLPPQKPTPSPSLALIHTDTGPYANQTALLNGVCYEFLASRAPVTWTWDSPDSLAGFFDEADNSSLCPTPAERASFDFKENILLGAVQTAHGCDAAHIITRDPDTSSALILYAQLVVRPGCAYELVEPLVIAVPRQSGNITYTLSLEPAS